MNTTPKEFALDWLTAKQRSEVPYYGTISEATVAQRDWACRVRSVALAAGVPAAEYYLAVKAEVAELAAVDTAAIAEKEEAWKAGQAERDRQEAERVDAGQAAAHLASRSDACRRFMLDLGWVPCPTLGRESACARAKAAAAEAGFTPEEIYHATLERVVGGHGSGYSRPD